MKKIIICALVALMVIPFAMLASSDVAVPAEPTLTSSTVIYAADSTVPAGVTADNKTGAGDSPTHVLKLSTNTTIKPTLFGTTLKEGGKVVFVGKGYTGSADLVIPASTSPIMLTASDGTTNYTSLDSAGNPLFMNDRGTNEGQFGMFIINSGKKVVIEGEVIFSDIIILNRLGATNAADPSKNSTFVVEGKMVVEDSVSFAQMRGNINYNMQVEEGGYLYLHADPEGFNKYTGSGTIVIGDEIKASVTADMFEGFTGNIVDKNGKAVFGAGEGSDSESETSTPNTPTNPTTPEYTGTDKVYIAYSNYPVNPINTTNTTQMISGDSFANGGGTLAKPYKTGVSGGWKTLADTYPDGATIVVVGKGYFGADAVFAASTKPYVFTAVDNGNDYTSRNEAGEPNTSQAAATPGQYGMFIVEKKKTVEFEGEVIFDNIVILNRITSASVNAGDHPGTIVFSGVGYIKDNVRFVNMSGNKSYTAEIPEGGCLILETLGFENYTGEGTIKVSDALKATVTEEDFKGFDGFVTDMAGNILFDFTGTESTEPETTEPEFEYVPGDTTPVEVPEAPAYSDSDKVYVGHGGNTDLGITASATGGDSGDNPYKTQGGDFNALIEEKLPNGGYVVGVGKVYFETSTIPALNGPIIFTATDGVVDYTAKNSDGSLKYMNATGGHVGQFGMFMVKENAKVTFEGDVIFENIVMLGRLSANGVAGGNEPAVLVVKTKMLVRDSVVFAEMTGDKNQGVRVEAGAFLYLETLGFEFYEGEGTIVVTDALKSTVKPADFAGFKGKVVDKDGNVIFSFVEDPNAPIEVPERPTYTIDDRFYIAHDHNNDRDIQGSPTGGKYPQVPYMTSKGWGATVTPWLNEHDGGTLVVVGKGYIAANYAFPATSEPIVITAKDGGVSYISRDEKGNIRYQTAKGGNDGQYGMFFFADDKKITFNGDVVFKDIVLLNRLSKTNWNKGKRPATLVVKKTLTIEDTVMFANMSAGRNYILEVRDGAYAYLDQAGFFNYTGEGTIVIGDNIKDKVKASMFGGFEGKVVDSQGNPLFPDVNLSELPVPTGDNFNGAFTAIIAVSALTVGAVLTFGLKKRREY